MENALFVANYIIEYSNNKNYEINNLKLQKLLYFVNVRNIVENDVELFSEKMEKWKYGPVVPSVYHEYKRFGAFTIPSSDIVNEYIEFSTDSFANLTDIKIEEYNRNKISNTYIIEDTVDKLSNLSAFQLVDITHTHDPWKKDENHIMHGIQGIKYTNEEIKTYFTNHPEAQLWETQQN